MYHGRKYVGLTLLPIHTLTSYQERDIWYQGLLRGLPPRYYQNVHQAAAEEVVNYNLHASNQLYQHQQRLGPQSNSFNLDA